MAYNLATVTGSFPGAAGSVTFTPPAVTDLTGTISVLGPGAYTYQLSGGSFTTAPLLATDNAGLLPESWSWLVTVQLTGSPAYSYSVLLPHSPSTVNLSALPVSAAAAITSSSGGSGGGGTVLSRATVLTANGNALANTIVPVNTTSNAVTVTLPNAPASGTVIAVKCITFGTGNNVTISANGGGSDVFNKSGGGATLTIQAANQGAYLCYDAATAIWTDLADDLPLSYLDALFVSATVMTTLGDSLYGGSAGAATRLPGNTSATKQFWTQTGTGSASAAPVLGAIATSDLPVDASGGGGLTLKGLGLGLMTMPWAAITSNRALTAQRLWLFLCTATVTKTINYVGCFLDTAGSSASTGVNEMYVYTAAGSLLAATGDLTTALSTAGNDGNAVEGTLSSQQTVTEGSNYYLGIVANFTTPPAIMASGTNGLNPLLNGNYLTGYISSQATVPGTITPSSMTLYDQAMFLYAR